MNVLATQIEAQRPYPSCRVAVLTPCGALFMLAQNVEGLCGRFHHQLASWGVCGGQQSGESSSGTLQHLRLEWTDQTRETQGSASNPPKTPIEPEKGGCYNALLH